MTTEVDDLPKNGDTSAIVEEGSEGEDGEIMDTDDSSFIPLSGDGVTRKYSEREEDDDDDEAPEEILNIIAKKKAEETPMPQEVIDPKLCAMCQKTPHKYRCPKCELRTCSVDCSKKHKEVKNCDGVRPPFQPVAKLSQFDANKSIQDQKFLHSVQENLGSTPKNGSSHHQRAPSTQFSPAASSSFMSDSCEPCGEDGDGGERSADGLRHKAASAQERYLIQNALRRRIWLSFTDDKGGEDCSRHEQFSDTIFWCIDLVFTKQLEDGSASEYTYRVQNIPETIRLVTVLRQFLKPRQHGCIVSRSDLDMEKMAPFIEAGIENINAFMLVPNFEPERFYVINLEKDVLHNTRNRVIVNHPRIILTLNTEFISSHQLVSEAEAEEIREKQRQSRAMGHAADEGGSPGFYRGGQRGGRGGFGFRGGRGGPSGGFRGGFRGGGGFRGQGDRAPRGGFGNRFDGKRQRDFGGGEDDFRSKRGRGGRGRGPPSHNYRSLDDEFDPFEPFEGPVRLPRSYLEKEDRSLSENDHNVSSTSANHSSREDEAIKSWDKVVAEKE
ncbi:hypothetical protein Q1695_002519 [Nippostrongylus brasiliensis]|nr:hypothetical protein Q1695_002519 [Nippostrongylus brasiliensis]